MQASCRGEVVREVSVGLTFAPYSKRSLTHSKFPIEQASHRGVLPSTFLASTCKTTPEGTILKPMSVFRCQHMSTMCVHGTWAPASSSNLTHCVCPRAAASCRGVMESTATIFTEAPLWIKLCSSDTWPWYAALWTSVLSAQKPDRFKGNHKSL